MPTMLKPVSVPGVSVAAGPGGLCGFLVFLTDLLAANDFLPGFRLPNNFTMLLPYGLSCGTFRRTSPVFAQFRRVRLGFRALLGNVQNALKQSGKILEGAALPLDERLMQWGPRTNIPFRAIFLRELCVR